MKMKVAQDSIRVQSTCPGLSGKVLRASQGKTLELTVKGGGRSLAKGLGGENIPDGLEYMCEDPELGPSVACLGNCHV